MILHTYIHQGLLYDFIYRGTQAVLMYCTSVPVHLEHIPGYSGGTHVLYLHIWNICWWVASRGVGVVSKLWPTTLGRWRPLPRPRPGPAPPLSCWPPPARPAWLPSRGGRESGGWGTQPACPMTPWPSSCYLHTPSWATLGPRGARTSRGWTLHHEG